MRYCFITLVCLSLWPSISWSQHRRDFNSATIPRHSIPIPPIGDEFGDRRRCHGPSPVWNIGGYYGPGFSPSWGVTYSTGPFGYSSHSYSSISYGVPGLSVGYTAPFAGMTYYNNPAWGYSNWGVPVYAAPPVYYSTPSPPLPEMPQWMFDEAGMDRDGGRRTEPQTHRSLIRPSTPEAQLRSVRLQEVGDRLMAKHDYAAASQSYAKSMQAAPDRPAPYVRLAIAKAARGDFRSAVSYLKQMAEVDPSHPTQADSLEQILGAQNGVAKVQLKQRVADWTKVDVRDADRVFLLGVLLFLDGDERFRTLLETSQKLDGDQPHLTAFLDASPVQNVAQAQALSPDEIDALSKPATPDSAIDTATGAPQARPPLLVPQKLPELPTP